MYEPDIQSRPTEAPPEWAPAPPPPAPAPQPKQEPRSLPDMIATALSWIMVPMFMPVYGMIFMFAFSVLSYAPLQTKLTVTAVIFGINAVVPMLIVLMLKFFGIIRDVGLNSRTERTLPYVVIILSFGCSAWFLWWHEAPLWGVMFFIGGMATGIVNLLINFRWKISAHAAAAAGVGALLIRILHEGLPIAGGMAWLIIWILLTGLLGSSRLWLGRHTPLQVLAGYCTGFLGVYLCMMAG